MGRNLSVVLLLAVLIGWSPAGAEREPSPGHEMQPEGTLTLDFLASDRDGRPAEGLTPGEVRLRIGGKVRPLLALERVGPDRERDIVLLIDEPALFGLEPVVHEAVSALLETLAPNDRISYLSTSRPGQLSQRPDHEAVLAGLKSMHTGPGDLWTCVPDVLRAIENVARAIPSGRGSTLAVLTRGVLEEDEELPASSIGCTVGRDDLRRTQQVIASAQINLHFLTVGHVNRSWGLDTVARNTGGTAGFLTWKDAGALARTISATRSFYRATFAPDQAARMPQRVELSTTRRGVRLTTSSAIELHPRQP